MFVRNEHQVVGFRSTSSMGIYQGRTQGGGVWG